MAVGERRIVVDDEEFSIRFEDQTLHATWLSGPVSDYGFSARPYEESISDADLAQLVREFLAQVGPEGVID